MNKGEIMKMANYTKVVSSLILLMSFASTVYSQQLAFPTAEGYGKYTVGGRGGKVIPVTNLNASGPGSLQAACEAEGPRIVVFKVAGTIDGNVRIRNDFITIAGQTAPGDGITIKGDLGIGADDVIIRYLRVRTDGEGGDGDAIGGRGRRNIILDHVSASWGTDEVLTLYHNSHVTIQNCIISEAVGDGESHKFGGIWGDNYSTYHHNLIAHNESRNPRFASGAGHVDFRNNVIYNWGYNSVYGGEKQQPGNPEFNFTKINMVANYYRPGPATRSNVRSRIVGPSTRDGAADLGKWCVSDNFVEGSPEVTADNWLGVESSRPDVIENLRLGSEFRLAEPWPAMPIAQQSAEEAYKTVLARVGCSLPKRDSIDARIIEEVRNGTATYYGNNGIISSPSDVGGWPTLRSGTVPVDSDHDGMPDAWETAHGLDPSNKNDGKKTDLSADSYTNLEMYLNELAGDPVKWAK